jgi:hypothetical protein
MVCPWHPMGDEVARRRSTVLAGGLGPWLVQEFRPLAEHHPFSIPRDDSERRWQPYPEASSAEEAYAMAEMRWKKGNPVF